VRVLFLTHRLPYPPDRGDRIRAYHLLRHLRTYAEVDLISFTASDAERNGSITELESLASNVHTIRLPRIRNYVRGGLGLPGRTPLTHLLLDSPEIRQTLRRVVQHRPPDVVLAFCSGMARFAAEPPLSELPLVVDMVDVDSRKWHELGERKQPPLRWIYRREARWLSQFEASIARQARASVVVNERERDILTRLAPGARVEVVQVGVDAQNLAPPGMPEQTDDVVFCGVMNYSLNVDGILWFARQVWPIIRARHPQARLKIVGSSPTAAVSALANPAEGIIVTGRVPDVRPYLWSSAVAIAPLLNARGVQTKVLEAIGARLPCVVTSPVAEGLPPEIMPGCTVADGPDVFAGAVVDVLARSPEARRAMTSAIDVRSLDWPHRLAPFRRILEDAIR
jgi:sugar transferase (PEP-CTERM/EpsH1 system associated)